MNNLLKNVKVAVTMVNDLTVFAKAATFTSRKRFYPNQNKVIKLLDAEHSLSETISFMVELYNIPTYVSTHLVRHRVGVTHFVSSNRNSKEDINRNTPVNHMMYINFQALRNMAKRRLCHKADNITRLVMERIKEEVIKINKGYGDLLIPYCIYRGKCVEPQPCRKRN